MNSSKNYHSPMSWEAVALLLAGLFFCSAASLAADSDEANIEETYYAWVRATNARDIERWSTFLAPSAFFAPPGVMPLDTEEAILNFYQESFADPEFSLDCEQLAVDVAESRDMAWTRGTCRATFTDSNGQKAKGTSRWFKIWQKQTDGSWKCRVNTWNYEVGSLGKILSKQAVGALFGTALPKFPQLCALHPHETAAIPLIHIHLRHVTGFRQSVASTS